MPILDIFGAYTKVGETPVVVITGSSLKPDTEGGIGFNTARVAAENGAHVAISGRKRENVMPGADKLASLGVEVLPFVGDLSLPGKSREFVLAAYKKWGRVDILINSLGVSDRDPVMEANESGEEFVRRVRSFQERMMRMNFYPAQEATTTVVELAQAANRHASILNNGTQNIPIGQGNLKGYAGTKAASSSWHLTLGHDLAMRRKVAVLENRAAPAIPWIRVNVVKTPWTPTPGETGYKQMETEEKVPHDWSTGQVEGTGYGEMTTPYEIGLKFMLFASPLFFKVNASEFDVEQYNMAGPPNRDVVTKDLES